MTSSRSWLRRRSLRRPSASGGAIFLQDNKVCCKNVTCREGAMVQDIIKEVCRQLNIPPMARVFFALCTREKGIPISPLSPYYRLTRQESNKQYQLRVFINIENSNFLQRVSADAHEYYYRQLRSDFIDDHLQPRATINSAVWMAAIEMAKEAKERQKNFEDLQGEMSKFMPEFLHKRYKKDSKVEEKIRDTFARFYELNVDNSHYVNKFLEVYEKDKMCGRHPFPLKQSGVLPHFRGAPPLVIISYKEGIYKTVAGDPDDRKEPLCQFADVAELRADISLSQLTVKKADDSETTLYFVEQKHVVAFAVIVQAYWRLKVDGSNIILRGDIAPPQECMMIDKSDRLSLCHGPITQLAVEQVLQKFQSNDGGHFLVRESRTVDDAYTLSVCYNRKVMHYRIIRHEDGMYSFRDPDGKDQPHQNGLPLEYEKFPTLHDLIKSYRQKADGLPTLLGDNITPDVAGKIPLLPPRNQPVTLTPSSSESPSDDDRPRSSSSEEHSYVGSTLSPTSSAPQTPSEIHPLPELMSPTSAPLSLPSPTSTEVPSPPPAPVESPPSPPRPQNKYIRELCEDGVPFILYDDLMITNKLGQGHFSKVFRAKMKDGEIGEVTVAVKIPEVDFDDSSNAEAAKKDLTREMRTMHSFDHRNIVKLIRVSETRHFLNYIGMLPVMIMEFVEGGSLRGYLDEKRRSLTQALMERSKTIFLNIGQQIAEGMKYLEERKVVHRDLAARNVLMVDESHVKISDFGLSRRKFEDKEYYKTKTDQAAVLPIFWYAPECLVSFKFTTQGDVWSYGTTLWEIFTYGDNPNHHLHRLVQSASQKEHPFKILANLYKSGKRLPQGNCQATIFKIINSCWLIEPTQRPSFDNLAGTLRELLQSILNQRGESALKQDTAGDATAIRTPSSTANGSANFAQNSSAAVAQLVS